MNPDRIPVERVLFGVVALAAVGLAYRAFTFEPGNTAEPKASHPQITLESPLNLPYAARHLGAAAGDFVDPLGPAMDGLRHSYEWRQTLKPVRTTTDSGKGGGDQLVAAAPARFVNIPVGPPAAGAPGSGGGGDGGAAPPEDEEEEPDPEFVGAVVSTGRRADGVWFALVRPSAWTDPLDAVEMRIGMVWNYNGEPYTILAIDDDGLRVRYADGREGDVPLGGAPASGDGAGGAGLADGGGGGKGRGKGAGGALDPKLAALTNSLGISEATAREAAVRLATDNRRRSAGRKKGEVDYGPGDVIMTSEGGVPLGISVREAQMRAAEAEAKKKKK